MNLQVSILFLSIITNLFEYVQPDLTAERKNVLTKLSPVQKRLSPIIKRRRKRLINPNIYDQDNFDRLEQCAIMYKNEEPIGILQPFRDSYRLLPVVGEEIPVEINPIPVRQSRMNVVYSPQVESDYTSDEHINNKRQDQISQYSDDRYPYIFAKFKIDSKVDKQTYDHNNDMSDNVIRNMHKRDVNHVSENTRKSNLNPDAVDEEIKNILMDMGLLDDEAMNEKKKREAEDENLELGTNKINLVPLKPLKSENLSKREDSEAVEDIGSDINIKDTESAHSAAIKEDKESNLPVELYMNKHTDDDKNLVSKDDARDKREPTITTTRAKRETCASCSSTTKDLLVTSKMIEDTQKIQEEDSAGKLKTVDETASSDVVLSTEKSIIDKREDDNDLSYNRANNDMSDYEKELLRQISSEIHKIKEQVKREVTTEVKRFAISDDNSVSWQNQRKKRQAVNTLLDEETSAIDPVLNKEEKLAPHVRRRRHADDMELTDNTTVARNKRFIGINPIFNNLEAKSRSNNSSVLKLNDIEGYRQRKLNQYDDDYSFLTNTLTTTSSSSEDMYVRKKRETNSDEEYEDESYENNPVELTEKKRPHHCNCNKNDPNCKCGTITEEKRHIEDESNAEDNGSYDYNDDSLYANQNSDETDEEIDKRDTSLQNQNEENEYDAVDHNNRRKRKSQFQNGEDFLDLYPAVYKISPVRREEMWAEDKPREKREEQDEPSNFNDLVALHGGAAVLNHLAAVRRRSMLPLPHNRIRRKTQSTSNNPDEQQSLINMSDEDLFGALPQSFEGELARFKRVKRSKTKR